MPVALSVRQPWLELVLLGRKTVEVRTWSTKHRGPLFLHASGIVDAEVCNHFGYAPNQLTIGAILGMVDLVDCVPFTPATWNVLAPVHLNLRAFAPRLVAWMLRDPRRIHPIEYRGQLGLFEIPEQLIPLIVESPAHRIPAQPEDPATPF